VSIRFLADADLNYAIVTGVRLREPGVDFASAAETALEGAHDSEVLRLAAAEERILVSHDPSSMPDHFFAFTAMGAWSPGVFLVAQDTSIRDVIDALILVWAASAEPTGRTRFTIFLHSPDMYFVVRGAQVIL
jgi:hypothetical protein